MATTDPTMTWPTQPALPMPPYGDANAMQRMAYLESQLRRIADGNWSQPEIDSASANTYAQIAAEMQNIAKLALTAIVAE